MNTKFDPYNIPKDFLMPFFRVNQKGIRVMDCEIKHVSEIIPGIREMKYHIPNNLYTSFVCNETTLNTITEHKTDYCNYILKLKLYLTEEKLRDFLNAQYDELKIRDKKVEDCNIKELLFAVNKKLGDKQ